MEKKTQTNWSEIRDQINEWWDDLADEELDIVEVDQNQLVKVFQKQYRYMRNPASIEVKHHTKDYRLENKEERTARDAKTSRCHVGSHHDGLRESKW